MADYRNAVLCVNGERLLELAVSGAAQIKFTSIKTSSTRYETTQLRALTDIGDIRQSSGISASTEDSLNTVSLYTSFSNAKLAEGYYVRNFGIYAADPDDATGETELLYAVVNADESVNPATFIPAYSTKGTSGVDFTCEIVVANSSEVTIKLDENAGVPLSVFNTFAEQFNAGMQAVDEKLVKVDTTLNEFGTTIAEFDTVIESVKVSLSEHTAEDALYSEAGVHNLRYHEGVLQVKTQEGNWEDAGGSGGGIAPNDCYDISVRAGNSKLTLFWSDPEDTVIEGQKICTWAGTKLVAKVGAYPEDVNDGILLLDNKVRNQYSKSGGTGFEYNNLNNGTTYYFALFPYSDQKAVNKSENNRASGTPQEYVVYGIEIDLTNSDPTKWATYTDDAVGMTAGSSAFDGKSIFDIQSYTFKDGAEVKALSKTDNTKYADGSSASADLTSGTYDIMTKFKRGGYYITHSGNKLIIKVTDDPNRDGFCYKAFQRGSVDKEEFYLGRYKGYIDGNSKLRSYSGVTPTGSKTISQFRTAAHATGKGYENSGFYQLVWRQCLYMVKYLANNSQLTIGKGYTGGSSVTSTGSTNGKGDTYGTQTNTEHMILFGIEDFWGNIWEWIDGLATDSARNILTNTDNFQDNGMGGGYLSTPSGLSSDTGDWMKDVQGTNDTGFVFKAGGGSSTTSFCDYGYLYDGCVAKFGGSSSDGDGAGVCYLSVSDTAGSSYAYVGGRVMFLAPNS